MLHYRSEGTGETVVFLHGFMESISMWDYLPLEDLPCKKIFIDLPGHGQSKLISELGPPSMQYFSDEVLAVLKHIGVNEFSVVGHSMGGYVALLLKEQVVNCKRVILLNSNFWSDNEQKKKDRVRIADIAFKAKKILIQESIPNLFGNPADFKVEIEKLKSEAMQMSSEAIAFASLAMRERNDFSEEIQMNSNDYFIVHGTNDRLVQTEDFKLRISNIQQLFLIEDTGHMAHIESPATVLELLQNFFQP